MPRKSVFAKEDAISILMKYIDYFKTREIPEYSAAVWKDLAKETEGIWNKHCWWVNVTNDRRGILTTARVNMGVVISESTKEENKNESQCEDDETWFDLILSKKLWDTIKPEKTEDNQPKSTSQSLQPGKWTNVIADEFYNQHSLPCAFSFLRNQVSVAMTRVPYLQIEGYCRSEACGNQFHGHLDKEPSPSDEEIVIRVRTRNTSRNVHDDVRRYLNGEKRKQLGKECHAEGSSNLLKRLKRENMERGDVKGPILPTVDVLRHAKHEHVNRELGIEKTSDDIVERILQLQFEEGYMGSIHGVGYNPFYSFYGLPEQLNLYQQYLDVMQDWSSIVIDGTGRLVPKIVRMLDIKSGHIFLHCIVIRCLDEIVSVFQMMTESQETETFIFWLSTFVGLVKKKPKQCVTDYSRALLMGCCKAFNNVTVKEYQNLIFLAITKGDISLFKDIATFIRVDVAHLIKMVCRWTATKEIQKPAVRDFAVRCVALMADCQYLADFMEIFSLTCSVLFHEHEDTLICINREVITVIDARKKLESTMSKRPVNIHDYNKVTEDDEEDGDKMIAFDADDEMNGTSNVEIFITKLVVEAQSVIVEGTEQNAFQALAFFDQLTILAVEFLLWTAVGMPFVVGHGSSCGSEKNFQDLKDKVLAKYSKRIGIEKFQRFHMNDLIGATRSMASKLTYFTATKCNKKKLIIVNFKKSLSQHVNGHYMLLNKN